MGATAGGSHDKVKRAKVFDEELFGCPCFFITSTIGHWLTATRLVRGINDIHVQLLQKLQGGDANFRIEKVNIAGNHQCNLHIISPLRSHAGNAIDKHG
jgi:hypothetical protein